MKTKIISFVLFTVFAVSPGNVTALPSPQFCNSVNSQKFPFAYGAGTAASPYLICNVFQLNNMRLYPNANSGTQAPEQGQRVISGL